MVSNIIIVMTVMVLGPVLTGVIFLQIFLSKKPNKWLGLILPIITFLISIILMIPSMENIFRIEFISRAFFANMVACVFFNIPTVVLLAIYLIFRKKIRKANEIEKMRIQDLE
jgi:hypothetical protein